MAKANAHKALAERPVIQMRTTQVRRFERPVPHGGMTERIWYRSTISNKEKQAVVVLPRGYDGVTRFPVLYVLHGFVGDCDSMLEDGMGIIPLVQTLTEHGLASPMILVFPSMYTSADTDCCKGYTPAESARYNAFREDLTECLMPYLATRYAIREGRSAAALAGFSMGGREALYIGLTRAGTFGAIAAVCPAPGIVPARDHFMEHPGDLIPSAVRPTGETGPTSILLAGGSDDPVVGTFPQQYHTILTENGVPHEWIEVPGGHHDASTVRPVFARFLRMIFR